MSEVYARSLEGPGETNTPSPESIEVQLAKILKSDGFLVAERLRNFLSFVVRQHLKGHTDQLKEFTIALAVFGKKPDFDPGKTAVVRTTASRLRHELEEYYRTAGKDDPILIDLPKGRYVPQFSFKRAANRTPEPDTTVEPRSVAMETPIGKFFSKERCLLALLALTLGFGLWGGWHGIRRLPALPLQETRPLRLFAGTTSEGHSPRQLETGQKYNILLMAPDGKTLYAFSSEDRSVAFIGVQDFQVKRTLKLPHPQRTAFLSKNGKHLYISSFENGVMVVDTATDRGVERVIATSTPAFDVAVSWDEKKLFLAMGHRGLHRINLQTGEGGVISPIACPVWLNIDPSGKRLYVSYQCGGPGGRSGHDPVAIYDVDSEKSIEVINSLAMVGGHPVFAPEDEDVVLLDSGDACSSPDYDHVGCVTVPSRPFYLWGLSNHRVIGTFSFPQDDVSGASFLQANRLVSWGNYLRVWDWARQMSFETLSHVKKSFGPVAITPRGTRAFASVSDTTGLLVFDAEKEACLPPSRGLVNFYAGDGTQDDSQASSALTFAGQPKFEPGLMGQAFSLNGDRSSLLVRQGSAFCNFCFISWSVSFFIKFHSTAGEMTILERETTDPAWDLRLLKGNDNHIVLTSRGEAASKFSLASGVRVDVGRWYHIAVVTEKDRRSLYLDGALQGEQHFTGTINSPKDSVDRRNIFFGATQGKRDFLNGLIDEIAVYDRVLSPNELKQLSHACGATK